MKTITVYLDKCHQHPDVVKEMNEWFGQLNSYYALWDRKIELTDSPDASIVLDSSVGVDMLKVLAALSFDNLENTDSFVVENLQFKVEGADAVSFDKLPFVACNAYYQSLQNQLNTLQQEIESKEVQQEKGELWRKQKFVFELKEEMDLYGGWLMFAASCILQHSDKATDSQEGVYRLFWNGYLQEAIESLHEKNIQHSFDVTLLEMSLLIADRSKIAEERMETLSLLYEQCKRMGFTSRFEASFYGLFLSCYLAFLNENRRYEEAIEVGMELIAVCNSTLYKESSDIIYGYENTAEIYDDMGNYAKAIEFYQKALDVSLKNYGKLHPLTASVYYKASRANLGAKSYEKAWDYGLKALEINKQIYGHNHLEVASCYNQLAYICDEQWNYDDSIRYNLESLEIKKKILGEVHDSLAVCYDNLGYVYSMTDAFDKALDCYMNSLDIHRKVYYEAHPMTISSYNGIAGIYYALGSLDTALEYYLKVFDISMEVLGQYHDDTAIASENIALAFTDKGDDQNALLFHLSTLHIRQKVLGETNPSTLDSYKYVGLAYERLGDASQAYSYLKKGADLGCENCAEHLSEYYSSF